MYKTDLSVRVGGLLLKNPVMPASGTYDYFEDNANCFPVEELGAIMLKSIHRQPRGGNPTPRIVEVFGGMINSIGIPSIGIVEFLKNDAQKYTALGTSVIASLSGSSAGDYYESVQMIDANSCVDALELNLSCPNVDSGLPFSSDRSLLREVVQKTRTQTNLPLIIKLSPNVSDISETARISEDCGADAVTIANTFRSMKIDIETQRPVLANIRGGLSGPCIKPIVMEMVYQTYEVIHIPIIACGGIVCWQDAVEYLLAGASMVQVGCGNFANPMLMPEVIAGIDDYLAGIGCISIMEIIGKAH